MTPILLVVIIAALVSIALAARGEVGYAIVVAVLAAIIYFGWPHIR